MPSRYYTDTTKTCFTTTQTEMVHSIFYRYIPWSTTTGWSVLSGGSISVVSGDISISGSTLGDGASYHLTGLHPGVTTTATLSTPYVSGTFTATITDDATSMVLGSSQITATQGTTVMFAINYSPLSSSATLSVTTGSSGNSVVHFDGV